jgi:hypothetical protein
MKRLQQDLINKSKLIKVSQPTNFVNSKSEKIQRVYNFAIDTRGGSDQELTFELAKKIVGFFIKLVCLIQKNTIFNLNILCWILLVKK